MIENHLLQESIKYAKDLECEIQNSQNEVRRSRIEIQQLRQQLGSIQRAINKDKDPENMCFAQPEHVDRDGNKFYAPPESVYFHEENQ